MVFTAEMVHPIGCRMLPDPQTPGSRTIDLPERSQGDTNESKLAQIGTHPRPELVTDPCVKMKECLKPVPERYR